MIRIVVSYLLAVAVAAGFGLSALLELHEVTAVKGEEVRRRGTDLLEVARLTGASDRSGRLFRMWVLNDDRAYLARAAESARDFDAHLARLDRRLDDPASRRLLAGIAEITAEQRTMRGSISGRSSPGPSPAEALARIQPRGIELQDRLDILVGALEAQADRAFLAAENAERASVRSASRVLGILGICVLVALTLLTWQLLAQMKKLRASREQLERTNRELDGFAGRVAHDLGNLLSPLSLSAHILERSAGSPERVRAVADRLQRLSVRSDALISALLGFARADRAESGPQSAPVCEAIADAVEDLGSQAAAVGANVEVRVCPGEARVGISPGLLHSVLVNVLGNALKFVDGREERSVRIAASAGPESCEIEIADTGPGIPAEALPRLFEPFYRVPGTSVAGHGIGLATVARIVGAHGGEVRARSEPGHGAVFTLRLPRSDQPAG